MTSRVPLRLVWPAHLVALLLVAVYLAMAVLESGLFRLGTIALVGAGLATWGALVRVSLPAQGSTAEQSPATIRGSRVLAGLLLTGWFLALTGTTLWGVVLWSSPESVPSIGFTVVMVLGALGSLPTLVALLRGRLHLWQVDLSTHGLRYAGGRKVVDLPWPDVSSVTLNGPGTQILLAHPTGADATSIPALAFDLPASQIVATIEAARASASHR